MSLVALSSIAIALSAHQDVVLKINRQTNKPPETNDRHNLNMKYNYHPNSIPHFSRKAKGNLKELETLEFFYA